MIGRVRRGNDADARGFSDKLELMRVFEELVPADPGGSVGCSASRGAPPAARSRPSGTQPNLTVRGGIGMFAAIARSVIAHPWRTVAVWVVAAVLLIVLSPKLHIHHQQSAIVPAQFL